MNAPVATWSPAPLSVEAVRLVEQHVGLVREVLTQVCRRMPAHVDRDDLFGAGTEALLDAVRRFDADRGATFPAFAAGRVRGAMLDEMRRWDWGTRSVRADARRRAEAVEALAARLGREPSTAEVATALGLTLDQVCRVQSDSARATVISLDALAAAGDQFPAGATTTPPDVLVAREIGSYLRHAVHTLPDRERHAIVGHYLHERPMRELAVELGVGESRVSQLCRRGLRLLYDGLAPYLLDEGPRRAPISRRRRGRRPTGGVRSA